MPPGALVSQLGSVPGSVGIAPVDPDRLPGTLPEGLKFSLVITVQSSGPGNFDTPIPACFPNLPDPETGELLGPGEKSALWSFDHDEGRWGIVGSMTVNEDGTLVCTNPGVGILAPGWHASAPGVEGEGGDIEEDEDNDVCEAGEIRTLHELNGYFVFDISTPGFSGRVEWSAPKGVPNQGVSNVFNSQYCEVGTHTITASLVKYGRNGERIICTSRSVTVEVSEDDVGVLTLSEIMTIRDPDSNENVGIYRVESNRAGEWAWGVEGDGDHSFLETLSDDGKTSEIQINFCEEGDFEISCKLTDRCSGAIEADPLSVAISELPAIEFENGDVIEHDGDVSISTFLEVSMPGESQGVWSWVIVSSEGGPLSEGVAIDQEEEYLPLSDQTTSRVRLTFCKTGSFDVTVMYTRSGCGQVLTAETPLNVVKAEEFENGEEIVESPGENGSMDLKVVMPGETNGSWTWVVEPCQGVIVGERNLFFSSIEETTTSTANLRFMKTGTYEVTLRYASNACGQVLTARRTLNVTDAGGVEIKEESRENGLVELSMRLPGGADEFGAGTWAWDVEPCANVFIDSQDPGFNDEFSYSYVDLRFTKAGTYEVDFTYTGEFGSACGQSFTTTKTLNVTEAEVHQVEISQSPGDGGYIDLAVELPGPDLNGLGKWAIEPCEYVFIGERNVSSHSDSTSSTAEMIFRKVGQYEVTFTYEDETCGQVLSVSKTLNVTNAAGFEQEQYANEDGIIQLHTEIVGDSESSWAWSLNPSNGGEIESEDVSYQGDKVIIDLFLKFCQTGSFEVTFTYTRSPFDPYNDCSRSFTATETLNVVSIDPNCGSPISSVPEAPILVQGEFSFPVASSPDGVGGSEAISSLALSEPLAQQSEFLAQVASAAETDSRLVKAKGLFYYYIKNRETGRVSRGTAGANGSAHSNGIRMRENTRYEEYILEASTLRVGYASWTTPDAGATFELPRFRLEVEDSSNDRDLDGLHDLGELIMGTNADDPDTDGDGLLDGSEVLLGLNPSDNVPTRIGVISTLDLEGDTLDVCAVGDFAVTANGEDGISIVNIFNGLQPVFMAGIDTAGTALAVACTEQYIAVADGDAGLAIVELRDPANESTLRYQVALGSPAISVAAGAGLAYVGLEDGTIAVVDFATGQIVGALDLGDPRVNDIVLGGERLFAVTNTQIHSISLDEGATLALVHSVDNEAVHGVGNRRFRLFAGEDTLLLTHFRGYNTYEIDFAGKPIRIALGQTQQAGWKQTVATGTGLALAAVSANSTDDGAHHISIYDSSDPEITDRFQEEIRTPGLAAALTLSNGLAYVADTSQGLQFVNYLAPDTKGQAPTLSLSHNFLTGQAEENGLLVVSASASDDVQVRHVDFFLDGERIASDGSFPYELRLRVPPLNEASSLALSAIARDTGGNVSDTVFLNLAIEPDVTPPSVGWVTPGNGAEVGYDSSFSISVRFSEPIDESSLDLGSILMLFSAGEDVAIPLTALYDSENRTLTARFDGVLLGGSYRIELASGLMDLAGNVQSQALSWEFSVPEPKVVTHSPIMGAKADPYVLDEIRVTIDRAVSQGDIPPEGIRLERVIENSDNELVGGFIETAALSPRTITLKLLSHLVPGDYEVTVSGIVDTIGNQVPAYDWSFSVRSVLPVGFVPGANEIVENGLERASIRFDSSLDRSTVAGGIELHRDSPTGSLVALSETSYDPFEKRVRVVFAEPLKGGYYYWIFKETLKDFAGRALGSVGSEYFFIVNVLPAVASGLVTNAAGDPVVGASVSIDYTDVEGVERRARLSTRFDGSFEESIVAYGNVTASVFLSQLGSEEAFVSAPVELAGNPGGAIDFGTLVLQSSYIGAMDTGDGHSLRIGPDRKLSAFGDNELGQVGTGEVRYTDFLVPIGDPAYRWSRVAAGRDHSHGIQTDGTLWSWGDNVLGQLGDGTQMASFDLKQVGSGWAEVSAGGWFSVGIKTDGTLWSWGYAPHGKTPGVARDPILSPEQIGSDSDWAKVFAGRGYVMAIKADGSLWGWGANGNGQLGDGSKEDRLAPIQIGSETSWVKIATSQLQTLGLKTDGSLWAWGANDRHQLGDGTTTERLNPKRIGVDTDWVGIDCVEDRSFAIKSNGRIWFWGRRERLSYFLVSNQEFYSEPVRTYAGDAVFMSSGPTHSIYQDESGAIQYRGEYDNPETEVVKGSPQVYGSGINRIEVDFSGDIDSLTATSEHIAFRQRSPENINTDVAYTLSFGSGTSKLIFDLDFFLIPGFTYSIVFSGGLLDVAQVDTGNNSAYRYVVKPPLYSGHYPPVYDNYGVIMTYPDVTEISVSSLSVFDPDTIGVDGLKLIDRASSGTLDDFEVPGVFSFSEIDNRLTLVLDEPLPVGDYYAEMSNAILNDHGHDFRRTNSNTPQRYFFEVRANPEVLATEPPDGRTFFYKETGLNGLAEVTIVFTEAPFDEAVFTSESVRIRDGTIDGAIVPYQESSYSAQKRELSLQFDPELGNGTYLIDLSGDIADTEGRNLIYDTPIQFTVESY